MKTLMLALCATLCFAFFGSAEDANLNTDPFAAEQVDKPTVDAAVTAVELKQAAWWQRSNEIQDALQKWIGVLTAVGTSLVGALLLLWGRFSSLIKMVKSEIETIKKGAPPVAAVLCLFSLSGCANMTPETRQRWSDAGLLLAQKATQIAGRVVLNALATSSDDREKKADFLDSAAFGLRSEMTNIVTADDVADVINIFTPKKPHWSELSVELARAYERASGTPAERLEKIAQGLNAAAASERQP